MPKRFGTFISIHLRDTYIFAVSKIGLEIEAAASAIFALILVMLGTLPQTPRFAAMRILSSICWNFASFASYGFLYIHLGPALDRARPCDHASPAWLPRPHTDQGQSEVVYPDSDMGTSRSPDSDSSVVGKLRNARATQLDIFGAPRHHAGND